MPHKNVETLRKIDEAQTRGDIEAFFANFTDDVKIHIGGASKLAGNYQGKDQFQELFGRYVEAAGADYSFESKGYFADDEHGVSVQTSHYRRDGQTLDTEEAFVVHFRGGQVAELWFLSTDEAAFDAWIGR